MSESDFFLKKIVKGAGITMIGIFIAKLLGLIYKAIIARHGVEEFGLFSLGLIIFSIGVTLSSLGFGKGITYYISLFKGKNEKEKAKGVIDYSFKLLTISSILISILLFLSAEFIAVSFFHNIKLSIVIRLLAISIPFTVLTEVIFSIMKSFQSVKFIVYSKDLIQNLSKLILTISFIFLGYNLEGIVLAFTLAAILAFIAAFYYLKKYILPFFKETSEATYSNKKVLLYSLPLMLTEAIILIAHWTDNLMLGYFMDATNVGLYNAILPFTNLFYLIPSAFMILFFPILSSLDFNSQKNDLKIIYQIVTKWVFLFNVFLLLIFISFPRQLLSIFGTEYTAITTTFMILSFGYFVAYTVMPSTNVLLALKKTKLILLDNIFLVVVNAILNFILIQKLGILGAAIATTISIGLLSLLILIQAFVFTKINPFKLNSLRILFSAALVFVLVQLYLEFIPTTSIYLVLLPLTISFILYLSLLLVTRTFEKQDLMIFKTIQDKFKINLDFLDDFLGKFI